jgi:hypothetical protein
MPGCDGDGCKKTKYTSLRKLEAAELAIQVRNSKPRYTVPHDMHCMLIPDVSSVLRSIPTGMNAAPGE